MINYIIQILLFQALFLAVYDLFLQKETFFKWNRIYLLASPFLSFIIPFLKFEGIQKSVPEEFIDQLPTVFINPQVIIEQTVEMNSTLNILGIIFYIGFSLFAMLFLVRLINIVKLIVSNKVIKCKNYNLVVLEERQSAFSFFNYIFIHEQLIDNNELEIVQHELVHCRQKHTIDLLIFELLKIVFWFNPFVYVYQNRISLLHEYISDSEVVKERNKNDYFNKLLAETFRVENISFINQFFKHSFIKKRILMITKHKSQKIKQLKYLLIVPLFLAMLLFSSFERKSNKEINSIPFTVNEIFMEDDIQQEILLQKASIQKFDTVNPLDDVPFAKIENVPIFPGCNGTEQEMRACLQEKITEHVGRNFNLNVTKNLNLTPGVKKIFVMFKIDNEGNITDVKAEAPHLALEEEAIRVVKLLPQMIAGKQSGNVVGVKYSLPIAFKIEDKNLNKVRIKSAKYVDEDNNKEIYKKWEDVPFAIIEDVPVFPGCEGTKEELKQCLIEKITKHVNRNFNIKMAKGLGLESGIKQIYVIFKIDKEGNITNVDARASHPKLEEEGIRVVSSLPQMTPGKQNGYFVNVMYSLPIAFKIE